MKELGDYGGSADVKEVQVFEFWKEWLFQMRRIEGSWVPNKNE